MNEPIGPGVPRGYDAFKIDDDTRAMLRAAGLPPVSKPTLPADHPDRVAIRAKRMPQRPEPGNAMTLLQQSRTQPTEFDRKVNRVIDYRLAEIREEIADEMDDDLDTGWSPFGSTSWIFETIAIPALVVGFTALCCLLASGLIWAVVAVWRAILQA